MRFNNTLYTDISPVPYGASTHKTTTRSAPSVDILSGHSSTVNQRTYGENVQSAEIKWMCVHIQKFSKSYDWHSKTNSYWRKKSTFNTNVSFMLENNVQSYKSPNLRYLHLGKLTVYNIKLDDQPCVKQPAMITDRRKCLLDTFNTVYIHFLTETYWHRMLAITVQ
jgi:hypothetical protein